MMLTRTESPSWLYEVERGATTIWERWDAILPDGSINPGDMAQGEHDDFLQPLRLRRRHRLGLPHGGGHRALMRTGPATAGCTSHHDQQRALTTPKRQLMPRSVKWAFSGTTRGPGSRSRSNFPSAPRRARPAGDGYLNRVDRRDARSAHVVLEAGTHHIHITAPASRTRRGDWRASREWRPGTALSDESARRLVLTDFAAVPEVVAFSYADGPSGIRGAVGATAFPTTIALAATGDRRWPPSTGRAVAHELFAAGHNVLLGPGIDIARDPHAGRLGESLGEDPLLAGELAGHVLYAIHGEGALAVLKHYVGNNVERLRTGTGPFHRRTDAVDVRIPEAALHEVYLAPFRRAFATAPSGLWARTTGSAASTYVTTRPARDSAGAVGLRRLLRSRLPFRRA